MAICRQVGDFETLLAKNFWLGYWQFFLAIFKNFDGDLGDFELFRKFMQILLHKKNILIL